MSGARRSLAGDDDRLSQYKGGAPNLRISSLTCCLDTANYRIQPQQRNGAKQRTTDPSRSLDVPKTTAIEEAHEDRDGNDGKTGQRHNSRPLRRTNLFKSAEQPLTQQCRPGSRQNMSRPLALCDNDLCRAD